MKNKKVLIGIILFVCVIFIFIKSRNKLSDISVKIDSVEQVQDVETMDWDYEGFYLKVKISITNYTDQTIGYLSSDIINILGKSIKEEAVVVNSSDDVLNYLDIIKPKETLSGYIYFKTSYEKNMKLKIQILHNITSDGSKIDGDTQEYLIDIKNADSTA